MKRLFFALLMVFIMPLTCYAEVCSIDILESSVVTDPGKVIKLDARVIYCGQIPEAPIWHSSNENVVAVDNNVIYSKNPGQAVITCGYEGIQDECTVIVNSLPDKWVNTKKCYSLLNKYRYKKKLPGLKRSRRLEKLARIRAKEIIEKFSHQRPNGELSLKLIHRPCKGENLAYGYKSCREVSKAWYRSKSHKANMLRRKFTKVGIVAYKHNGVIYWVQLFSE